MLSTLFLSLSFLTSIPPIHADSWGPAYSLGPTTSRIILSETTLLPGDPPSDAKDMLTIWPGISDGTGDLIQSTVEQWADNSWCGASDGQWCVRASLFGEFGQIDGPSAPVSGDQKITITYTRNTNDNGTYTWTQLVTDTATGEELSTLDSDSGDMTGWGTGTECNDQCVGTTSPQVYSNTKIVLESEDPEFSSTAVLGEGVTASDMVTDDGGKTWTIKEINLPAMV